MRIRRGMLFIFLISLFTLVGCSENNKENADQAEQEKTDEDPQFNSGDLIQETLTREISIQEILTQVNLNQAPLTQGTLIQA